MTLSVEMIAESMQPFGARVVMQQERTFAFRRVQMLTPESENTLEEDVLYVSEPKVIRRLPKGLLHDHFFVVRARPEDAEPVRPGVNALLYDEQYSLGAVTNHLLTLFDRLQTLEYQMRLAVRAHAGLEPLMEVGRKMIPDATIVVVDSAYNIIGATRERGSGISMSIRCSSRAITTRTRCSSWRRPAILKSVTGTCVRCCRCRRISATTP